MAKVIYKYPLQIQDQQVIDLPKAWKILTVQQQGLMLTMWAIVDPDNETEPITISIYGTGHTMRGILEAYISTVQMDNGLVWHLFLVK